jgi:hypothetical protein
MEPEGKIGAIEVRFLVEKYYDVLKPKVSTFNRIVAYVKDHASAYGIDPNQEHERNAKLYAKVADDIVSGKLETPAEIADIVQVYRMVAAPAEYIAKKLDIYSKDHPLRCNYLSNIQGIGRIISSGIIAWIGPISRFDNVSKLWAYAGFSAEHWKSTCERGHKFITTSKPERCRVRMKKGKRAGEICGAKLVKTESFKEPPRRTRGYVLFVNQKLHSFVWKIARSFEYQKPDKSFYRRMYDTYKAEEKRKGISDGHARNRALRKTAKLFLAHLWETWRRMEGLPVSEPYMKKLLGHEYIPPQTDK